jgi:membrane-associated phospholipid phosphatase
MVERAFVMEDGTPLPPRLLPRGRADAVRQLLVWCGFALAYEAARAATAGDKGEALRNAQSLIRLEDHVGGLPELDVQRLFLRAGSSVLLDLADWTYWLAQFGIVAIVLVWVYLRRDEGYTRLRNSIIVANTLGLIGYVLVPVAPPRLVSGHGFVDTLALKSALNHQSGLVELFSNQYAAMPSLHAADALLIGIALAALVRAPLLRAVAALWPIWVSICVVATGNHFWVDIVAGLVLGAAGWVLTSSSTPAVLRRLRGSWRLRPTGLGNR